MLQESDAKNASTQHDLFICESAVLIKSSGSTQLLCGLRNGTLIIFRATLFESMRIPHPAIYQSLGIPDQYLQCASDDIRLERINTIKFGPIPVRVITHVQQENIVLVLAGSELYRFKMSGGEVNVSQIVFEGTMIEVCGKLSSKELNQTNPGLYSRPSLRYLCLTTLQAQKLL